MPNPIARLRNFWLSHGEWVLLGICCMLFTSFGFSMASSYWRDVLVQSQREAQRETIRQTDKLEGEKQYLRERIVEKNQDIRFLQGKIADRAQDAGDTAKSSTDALKALSESTGNAK